MTTARNAKARVAAGSSANREQQQSGKPTGHRPEFQGKAGNARNRCQASPVWPELPGARAMRQLEALWGKPRDPRRRGRR